MRWWEWLLRHGFPEGFRVLCHNCNQAIGVYGACPHQTGTSPLADSATAYDPDAPNRSYKLTAEQVRAIRAAIADGVPQCQLAQTYHVSRATICLIHKGRNWKTA